MNNIETDGRRLENVRDPPGQRSAYIPPGDPERETYRLSTFRHFPRDSPIDPRHFAANGFYYTGYRDRVKCFSCGQPTENWLTDDDVTQSQWHMMDCPWINGTDNRNVPIGSLFLDQNQTAHSQRQSIQGLSSTTPNPYQNIESENRNRETERSSSHQGSSIQNQGALNSLQTFPCLHPVNPHMRSREARLQTFLDNSTLWPAHRIRASPQQIVDVGMYYLGDRDRVKCWYCNGGLQNWERDDIPWEEHAKWFPMCEYVLQQKGPHYVHGIASRFPNLRRPALLNSSTAPAANQLINRVQLPPSSPRHQRNERSSPIIVDPHEELRIRDATVEEQMRTSEIVSNARTMGFKDGPIKEALKRQYQQYKQTFSSLQTLVEAVLEIEVSAATESEERQNGETAESSNAACETPAQEMRRLEETRRCKKCHKEDACVVFIPCGHLASCVQCAERIGKCLLCNELIREKVRSYIS